MGSFIYAEKGCDIVHYTAYMDWKAGRGNYFFRYLIYDALFIPCGKKRIHLVKTYP